MRRSVLAVVLGAAALVGGYAYLQHAEPAWWVRLSYPLSYQNEIRGYSRIYHLDPAMVAAVIYEESRFQPDTRSSAGAIGLMQLLPSTARGIALRTGGGNFHPRTDLLNPDLNIRYGCWYLQHLLQKYRNRRLALAAYNAGQSNVDAWIAAAPSGQQPAIPFAATRTYVADVGRLTTLYRRGYAGQLGYS
jgi:soluble lytic murein transglycosylase